MLRHRRHSKQLFSKENLSLSECERCFWLFMWVLHALLIKRANFAASYSSNCPSPSGGTPGAQITQFRTRLAHAYAATTKHARKHIPQMQGVQASEGLTAPTMKRKQTIWSSGLRTTAASHNPCSASQATAKTHLFF